MQKNCLPASSAVPRRVVFATIVSAVAFISSACASLEEQASQPRKANHVIITLDNGLSETTAARLALNDIRLLGRRTDREYYALIPDAMAPTVDGEPSPLGEAMGLKWRTPGYEEKVAAPVRSMEEARMDVLVQVYPDVSRSDLLDYLVRLCIAPECFAVPYGPRSWKVTASNDALTRIAELDIVKRIEPATGEIQLLNPKVRAAVDTNAVHTAGYKGVNVKAGVSDEGIYRDHDDFQPQDWKFYASRISGAPTAHATLVASILAGGNGSVRYGHAPQARLGNYPFISADYEATRKALVEDGSQVTNHSYTLTASRGYWIEVAEVDELIRGGVTGAGLEPIPAVPQVWAGAGEGGAGLASNEGKNMIVVSSVDESTCGAGTSCIEPFDPVKSLTLDGRIKPDVVAPGCRKSYTDGVHGAAASGKSDFQTLGCASSFAAPVVSGAIALMINARSAKELPDLESPASYRAAIVQTATDQLGPEEGDAKGHLPGPDVPSGWGMVNVSKAVQLAGSKKRLSEGLSIDTMTETDTYCMKAPPTDAVRVTLAWDDLPGEGCDPVPGKDTCSLTTSKLVQDLDLCLHVQNGPAVYPWSLTASNGTVSQSQSSPDRSNNIERVDAGPPAVTSAEEVTWYIDVSANRLIEPQIYSIAASHDFAACAPQQPDPCVSTAIVPDTTAQPPDPNVIIPEPDPFGSLVTPVRVSRICGDTFGCTPCAGSESGWCAAFALELVGVPDDAKLRLFDSNGRAAEPPYKVRRHGDTLLLRIPSRPVDADYYVMVAYGGVSPGTKGFLPLRYRIPRPEVTDKSFRARSTR